MTGNKAPNYRPVKCCGNCFYMKTCNVFKGFISDDCTHPDHPFRYANSQYVCDNHKKEA